MTVFLPLDDVRGRAIRGRHSNHYANPVRADDKLVTHLSPHGYPGVASNLATQLAGMGVTSADAAGSCVAPLAVMGLAALIMALTCLPHGVRLPR